MKDPFDVNTNNMSVKNNHISGNKKTAREPSFHSFANLRDAQLKERRWARGPHAAVAVLARAACGGKPAGSRGLAPTRPATRRHPEGSHDPAFRSEATPAACHPGHGAPGGSLPHVAGCSPSRSLARHTRDRANRPIPPPAANTHITERIADLTSIMKMVLTPRLPKSYGRSPGDPRSHLERRWEARTLPGPGNLAGGRL